MAETVNTTNLTHIWSNKLFSCTSFRYFALRKKMGITVRKITSALRHQGAFLRQSRRTAEEAFFKVKGKLRGVETLIRVQQAAMEATKPTCTARCFVTNQLSPWSRSMCRQEDLSQTPYRCLASTKNSSWPLKRLDRQEQRKPQPIMWYT